MMLPASAGGSGSLARGAMVEKLAFGVHAVAEARAIPANVLVVLGAGPIGMVTVITTKAAGCAKFASKILAIPNLTLRNQ